ncbi:MAG TPA: alpha/beta hydrolase [Gemmatimonadota bacterium]|jgi:pimeloyl-ACP methyl ester carboxylesterase
MIRTLLIWAGVAAAVLVALRLLALLLEPRLAFYPQRGVGATPRDLGLEFRELEIQTSDRETLAAWWLPHPEPRAEVLFWHGNGGNLSLWLDVLAGIRARGFSVFALDYRGYGASTGSPTEKGIYLDTAAFVRRFRDELHRPGVPVVYWGRSLGAAAAAYATNVEPPDALILESPFAEGRSVVRDDPFFAVLSVFASYRFPTASFLESWRGPSLVIHGDADRVVPIRHGRELFDRLEGDKRFLPIRGADHEDVPQADPATYWRGVDELLERVIPPGARPAGPPAGRPPAASRPPPP